MSTLVLTIDAELTAGTLSDALGSNREQALAAVGRILQGVEGGAYNAAVTIGLGTSDPVRASGTMTIVYASLAANDTVAVAGQTLTCVTSAPSANQFRKETDGTVTAANLAAAINAATTSAARVSATSSGVVVTVRAHNAGTAGNLIALTSSGAGVTLSGANLASGAGGVDRAPVSYSFGK
jgi:phage tail sheath gpL-like